MPTIRTRTRRVAPRDLTAEWSPPPTGTRHGRQPRVRCSPPSTTCAWTPALATPVTGDAGAATADGARTTRRRHPTSQEKIRRVRKFGQQIVVMPLMVADGTRYGSSDGSMTEEWR